MKLKEGGVVGIPLHPTSCSVATTNLADRIAAAVQTAFSKIADGMGMAEVGAVIPPADGVISGVDPRTGEAFVNQLFLGATGGGGSPTADCWATYCHVGNGGLCYLDSVELDEIYQPIHVHSRYMMTDTEGAGRFRGAPSLYVEYGPVDCAIEIGYVSDGVDNTAKGVRGGGSGNGAEQYRRTLSGDLETLDPCAQVTLLDGETVVSISCGGGGYGPADDRDPEKVRHDVQEGWISKERARDVYHVVLTDDFQIDVEATTALRAG
jgi:N-methylhydantoinase B